jgi:hypothetical protein
MMRSNMGKHVSFNLDGRITQASFLIMLIRNHVGRIIYFKDENVFRVYGEGGIPEEVNVSLREFSIEITNLLKFEMESFEVT